MNTSATSRILWPHGPSRVLFSVVAVLSAVGLYVRVPAFARSPLTFSLAAMVLFAFGVQAFEWGLRRYERRTKLKDDEKQQRVTATQGEILATMARIRLFSEWVEALARGNEQEERKAWRLTTGMDETLLRLVQQHGVAVPDRPEPGPLLPVWLLWSLALLAPAIGVFVGWLLQ
jgi:hypothetical protein